MDRHIAILTYGSSFCKKKKTFNTRKWNTKKIYGMFGSTSVWCSQCSNESYSDVWLVVCTAGGSLSIHTHTNTRSLQHYVPILSVDHVQVQSRFMLQKLSFKTYSTFSLLNTSECGSVVVLCGSSMLLYGTLYVSMQFSPTVLYCNRCGEYRALLLNQDRTDMRHIKLKVMNIKFVESIRKKVKWTEITFQGLGWFYPKKAAETLIYRFIKEYFIRVKALSFPLKTKASNLLLANTVVAGVACLACYSMALLAGLCFNKLI